MSDFKKSTTPLPISKCRSFALSQQMAPRNKLYSQSVDNKSNPELKFLFEFIDLKSFNLYGYPADTFIKNALSNAIPNKGCVLLLLFVILFQINNTGGFYLNNCRIALPKHRL